MRDAVGIFDASTLGKIEVVGPDASEFMNRIYTNGWSKLKPGRCRYGLMLKEDGYIMDDGVVARMADDRFHVTTTTGGAPRVLAHMEDYLQTEWPDLDVFLTSTTEHWAVIAVQGPKARDTIAGLVEGIELGAGDLPHMSVREGHICGIPCRLFRVSFTGELGFEINVPADYGRSVWEAIWQAGQTHGITAYGTETMHVLRAEKGFIIVGQETDGTVTAEDAALTGLVSKVKQDFVGKRSLARPDIVANGRKQLVGLLTDNPDEVLDEGAQIVDDPNQPIPMKMLGHVTSSYWSANRGTSIALALVAGGHSRLGDTLYVTTPDGFTTVKVAPTVFIDPKGSVSMLDPIAGIVRRSVFRTRSGGSSPSLKVSIAEPLARWSLRLRAADIEAIGEVAGFDVTGPINSALRHSETGQLTMRLGPDEWMATADPVDADSIAASMRRALANRTHALVDISHRMVAFEIAGHAAGELLASNCPLDLNSLSDGGCTRTVFGEGRGHPAQTW